MKSFRCQLNNVQEDMQSFTKLFWKCLQVKSLKTTILGNPVRDQYVEWGRMARNWAGHQLGDN